MSDERERSDAAADGSETGEVDATGGRGRTALVTRPVTGPLRPTGKRSRQRGAVAGEGGGADVASSATELTEVSPGGSAAQTGKVAKVKKLSGGLLGKKKPGEPSRNPIIYVYNYLKQVTGELRKVIWPNRKQMITYTSVVLAFLVFMVALIAGSDYGFAKLVLLVFGE